LNSASGVPFLLLLVCFGFRHMVCFAAVAGIRECGGAFSFSLASAMRLAAQALPLCGAAPTFLCSGKEK
jgi:hypothetical protein